MYNDMYPSLLYHTEYFHCPKNPLCFLPSCPSLPHPVSNPWFFTISIVLPFPECHVVEIIQCIAFSDSVQSLSCVRLFVTPWIAARQASLSITNSRSSLKLTSIESVMPSNCLILCPLLLLPSIFPSTRIFPNPSVLPIKWPKDWSFSFSISPFNEYSGLTSFRINWFDLLAFQGTLKSLLQHLSSKASILWHSAFFIVQFSHTYMTTGKIIALTRQTFVGKVMSLFLICCLGWS